MEFSDILNVYRRSLTGLYEPAPDFVLDEGDCLVGQSFGSWEADQPGLVNERIADFMGELALAHPNITPPLVAQEEVAQALSDRGHVVDYTIEGSGSTTAGGALDSWKVLQQVKQYTEKHDVHRPVLCTQAYLVGRLAVQSDALGLDPIFAAGMPLDFAPDSKQWWTRDKHLWGLRELVGIPILWMQGKL